MLGELARDDAAGHDPALYEALPRNETGAWMDVVLRGGQVLQPGAPPYRADVAFDRRTSDQSRAGCGPEPAGSRIGEIGDARFLGAGETIDASGTLIAPALTASVRGLDARAWLTPAALEAIGRLGVATLRWHVPAADHAAAVAACGGAPPARPARAPARRARTSRRRSSSSPPRPCHPARRRSPRRWTP